MDNLTKLEAVEAVNNVISSSIAMFTMLQNDFNNDVGNLKTANDVRKYYNSWFKSDKVQALIVKFLENNIMLTNEIGDQNG